MTASGRHRWSVAAASGLTLLLFFSFARLQTPIQMDVADRLAPDSLGRFSWGPQVVLEPGRYRAQAGIQRRSEPLHDPAEATGMVGFRPAGSPWGYEAWLLRGTEFSRDGERILDFKLNLKQAGSHGWVWRGVPGENDFELIATRVVRESSPWSVATGGTGMGPVTLGVLSLLAGGLLLLAGTMGNRAAARQSGSGVHHTWAGLLVYLLAGVCLMTAGRAIVGGAAAEPSLSQWVFYPGMGSFAEVWPAWLAAAIALAAAWAIGVITGQARVLLWALPVAALGLWFGSQLAGPRSDFQIYYSAGLSLWSSIDPYAIRPERVLNPPPFVLATALFPLLPLTWSGFVWFGIKAAATVWCLVLARLAVLPSSSPRRWFLRPEWIALWISGRYVLMDLQYGNTNVLVLLALIALAAFWRSGHKLGAGVAAAIGTAIKLTPILTVITAGFAGRMRWAAGTALLSAALLLISAGALEWRAEGAGSGFWRDVVAQTGSVEMGRVDNQSLRALTLRAVAGTPILLSRVSSIPNLGLDQTAARIAELILAAGVLWILFLLGRAAARGGDDQPGGWAGLWAGTALGILLLSPGTWSVHYALLYLPLVVLVDRAQRGQRSAAVISTLLAVVIVLPIFSRLANDWFTALSLLPILSLGALLVLVRGVPFRRSGLPVRGQEAVASSGKAAD